MNAIRLLVITFIALALLSLSASTSVARDDAGTDLSASCASALEISQSECKALVALYESTDGATWLDNSHWLDFSQIENWHGVVIDEGHVIEIYLPDNGLQGVLPDALGDLSHLEFLDVASNQLSGHVPNSLGSLPYLEELDLSNTLLSGALPHEIMNLSSLTMLETGETDLCVNHTLAPYSSWLLNAQDDSDDRTLAKDYFGKCTVAGEMDASIFLPVIVRD